MSPNAQSSRDEHAYGAIAIDNAVVRGRGVAKFRYLQVGLKVDVRIKKLADGPPGHGLTQSRSIYRVVIMSGPGAKHLRFEVRRALLQTR
jgi:hypothetical protein